MQRISGATAVLLWLYVLVGTLAAGAVITLIVQHSHYGDISDAKLRNALYRAAAAPANEPLPADLKDNELAVTTHRIADTMRALDAQHKLGTYDRNTALRAFAEHALKDPASRTDPKVSADIAAIIDRADMVNTILDMDNREHVIARIILDKRPAPAVEIPSEAAFQKRRNILWGIVYVAGAFVTLFVIRAKGRRRERQFTFMNGIQWAHFGNWLVALLTLPASASVVSVLTIRALTTWDIAGTGWKIRHVVSRKARAAGTVAVRVGYRLRLLRQIPAPQVHPDAITVLNVTKLTDAGTVSRKEEGPKAKSWVVIPQQSALGKRHLLRAAGIDCYPIRISSPAAMRCLAFDTDDFADARRILGLVIDTKSLTTDVARTQLCVDSRTYGDIRMTVRRESGDAVRELLQTVSTHAGGIGLAFRDCGWESDATPEPGVITVSVRATTGDETKFVNAEATGNVVPLRGIRGVLPGPSGYLLRDELGTPVAQIRENAIDILFDYLGADGAGDAACETIARILHEAIDMHRVLEGLSPAERASRETCSTGEAAREQFVDARLAELRAAELAVIGEIASCDNTLTQASAMITNGTRGRLEIADRLASYAETGVEQERERLANEFDRLYAMDHVVQIVPAEGCVGIETEDIVIAYKGTTYLIGRVLVQLYEDGNVRIYRVANNRFGGVVHPHVNGDGVPCLGNIAESLAKLAARREFAAEFALVMRFLSTWNPADQNAPNVTKWPTVDPKEHAKRVRTEKRGNDDAARTRYVDICAAKASNAERSMRQDIVHIEAEMARAQKDIVTATRLRNAAKRRLTTLRDGRLDVARKKATRAFDDLLANPAIASVNGFAGRLEVFTHPLVFTHGGDERYIGRLKIDVRDDGTIRIVSVEKPTPATHPHPNITKDGKPRFGEFASEIAALVSDGESAEAVERICRFLGTVQDDDRWLTPLKNWPTTKKGEQ